MRNYEELIQSANAAMLEKLKENEHKPGFDNIIFDYAISRIKEENCELDIALFDYKSAEFDFNHGLEPDNITVIKTLKAMRREAADCANFPAMIILKCDKMIAKLEADSDDTDNYIK